MSKVYVILCNNHTAEAKKLPRSYIPAVGVAMSGKRVMLHIGVRRHPDVEPNFPGAPAGQHGSPSRLNIAL